MGFHGYLLELRGCSFRALQCRYFNSVIHIYPSDICILRRLHGITWSIDVPVLNTYICSALHDAPQRLLYVSVFFFSHCPLAYDMGSWDTSMSQKSRFKMQTQGIHTFRNTFPQLPWGIIKNPTYIQTAHGYALVAIWTWCDIDLPPSHDSNRLLTSGWWAYSRKPVNITIFQAWTHGH